MEENAKWKYSSLALLISISLVYFIYGKLGLELASVKDSATAIWVPTGIAFASLLLFGYRVWPAIFVGAFLVNFSTTSVFLPSIVIAIGNTLEGVVGTFFINKLAKGKRVFERPRNFYNFVFFTVFLATMISATFGVITLSSAGLADWSDHKQIWFTWWLGDLFGALIFAPTLILWGLRPKGRWEKRYEFILLLTLIFIVGWLMASKSFYFSYLIIPMLIWASLRFSTRGTSTAITMFAIVAIGSVLQDFNQIGVELAHDQNTSLLLMQTYVAFISLVILPLSITLSRRQRLELIATEELKEREEQARTEFIANAAHELRTPLTVIKGNIDLSFKEGGENPLDPYEALRAIDTEVSHLSGILSDLLLFGVRGEKLKNEVRNSIDIPGFIDRIVKRCRALAYKKNISITLEKLPQAMVLGSTEYMEKVFSNIIKNAITYGKPNGNIKISAHKNRKDLKIVIEDNGIGISEENLPHIFERFFRVNNSVKEGERTGLGLAIVKEIVEGHGGDVEVESILGKGSTFIVTLPLVE